MRRTATDAINMSGHAFTLTGLQPGATYYYRLSNNHALDGDSLASTTGSFETLSDSFAGQFLQPLDQSTDPAQPILNTGKNGKVGGVKIGSARAVRRAPH